TDGGVLRFAGKSARATRASRRKRRTAAARLSSLRIHEYETLLHQGFLIVERHAMQINERLRIHKHSNVIELKDSVTFARLSVETNVVAQARATAALHAKAQAALLGRNAFLGHGAAHLREGLVRHDNAFCRCCLRYGLFGCC